jgi:hypothetical protein
LSKLEERVRASMQLAVPEVPGDTIGVEATSVFYAENEFAISIESVPSFVSCTVNSFFRPSDLVARVAVLYGPPTSPGGGAAF